MTNTNVAQLPVANQLHNLLGELNGEFAVVPIGGTVCILREITNPSNGKRQVTFLKVTDFKTLTMNRFGDERTSAADFFLSHPNRREYRGVDFYPGQAPTGVYNLWRGFSVQPQKGNAEPFWTFVREVVCAGDAKAYTYVRKWLAHMVQRPHEIPEVALVQRGPQGTGKNFFADTVGSLVADHYMPVSNLEKITGRFNGHLAHVLLVHANEATWGGNKSAEGALKAMITDPSIAYEFKNKDVTQMRNFKRLIVSSNEDWAVPRGMDDRRFFVLDVSDRHKEDHAYFGALKEELDNGGREALMYELTNEDISDFNPRRMPANGAGLDIKLKSATSIERWLYELLNNGYHLELGGRWGKGQGVHFNVAGDRKSKCEIYDAYCDYCSHTERTKPEAGSQFWKKLRQILGGLREERGAENHEGHRSRMIVVPSLTHARVRFEQYVKQPSAIEWDTADESTAKIRLGA
jgi:hypothetical protein